MGYFLFIGGVRESTLLVLSPDGFQILRIFVPIHPYFKLPENWLFCSSFLDDCGKPVFLAKTNQI